MINISNIISKGFLIAILIPSSLIGCSLNGRTSGKIRFINIVSEAKAYRESGDVFNIDNSLRIAFYKEYRIHVYPRITQYNKEVKDATGKTIDEVAYRLDTTYTYIVSMKGNNLGLKYSSLIDPNSRGKRFNLDSLNRANGLYSSNFKVYNAPRLGDPIEVIRNDGGKVILERFLVPKEKNNYPDSIYRYYDETLKEIDFSFIPELDQKHNSKLVRVSMVFNPIAKGLYAIAIPRRESFWEMKEIYEKNPGAYLQLIERFKKDSKGMDLANPKSAQ